jgi:signal transduction histidine kinase
MPVETTRAAGRAPPAPPDDAVELAHDLRGALHGIQAWIEVLEQCLPAASPAVRRALDGIRTGVREQTALIERRLAPASRRGR